MRAIKFRAWTGKKMFYQEKQYLASFIRRAVPKIIVDHDEQAAYREHESYLPNGGDISEYLMQFTGLLDASGHEIYEGDYLANDWGKYRVYWDRGGFIVESEDGHRHNIGDIEVGTLKVIGNCRENPELAPFFEKQ